MTASSSRGLHPSPGNTRQNLDWHSNCSITRGGRREGKKKRRAQKLIVIDRKYVLVYQWTSVLSPPSLFLIWYRWLGSSNPVLDTPLLCSYLCVFARVLSNFPIRHFTIELCYCLPNPSRIVFFSISAQVTCRRRFSTSPEEFAYKRKTDGLFS